MIATGRTGHAVTIAARCESVEGDSLKYALWGGGLDWFSFGIGDKFKGKASIELVN